MRRRPVQPVRRSVAPTQAAPPSERREAPARPPSPSRAVTVLAPVRPAPERPATVRSAPDRSAPERSAPERPAPDRPARTGATALPLTAARSRAGARVRRVHGRLAPHVSKVRPSAGLRALATRARARHRPSRRVLAGLVASLLVLVLAAWVVLASPLLALRDVRVSGTERLDPAQVEALVRQEEGTPLLRLDAAGLAERIEALPLVGTAEVLRAWPRTAEVRVTERLPVAVVPAGAGVALVDVEGRRLLEQAEAPADLPELSAATERAGARAVQAALAVVGQLPLPLRAQVASVDARSADSVRLTLRSEAEVVWGGADESPLKAEVLAVLLTQPADEYDVSAPRNPVTR